LQSQAPPPPVEAPKRRDPPKPRPAAPKPAPGGVIFDADEDEEEQRRDQRRKMKLERLDYGEHALESDRQKEAALAKTIIDKIPVAEVLPRPARALRPSLRLRTSCCPRGDF
jgi:hypothetical protein